MIKLERALTVGSFGGGANSTAMYIGMALLGEPLDLNLFADPGDPSRGFLAEKPETYEHIKKFSEWMVSKGYPPIITVRSSTVTLEEDCLTRKALPAIAYGYKTCSQRFKLAPQRKFINNWEPAKSEWAAGNKITSLVGYDAGEPQRAERGSAELEKSGDGKKYVNRYFLIEWGWDRKKCEQVCLENIGYIPPKSACHFCPSTKPHQVILSAKTHPVLFNRAVAMEQNADLTQIAGLGRDFAWKDLVEFSDKQIKLFDDNWSTAEVPCGCYDG